MALKLRSFGFLLIPALELVSSLVQKGFAKLRTRLTQKREEKPEPDKSP